MFKIIYLPVRIIRRILKCLMPYDGLKNRKLIKSYAGFQQRFYDKFWKNVTHEMGASLTDVGYGYYKIEFRDKKTYVADFRVMLDDHLTLKVAGNKPMVLKILQESGLQAPKFLEYKIDSIDKAKVFLEKLGKNAVVKPASGTGSGRGVTTRINSLKKLKNASLLAASYNDNLLIEEQVEGDSFRLLYLDGKFIDAIRRDPPNVIGDGVNSIKKLIKNENLKRTETNEIITFHPLIIDMECKLKLKEQGLSINSIPENNKKIIIKSVVNQNSCYENHIVRDEVHPDIISMGRDIVNELGIVLGGIDVITRDITVPLNESNGIINEINTTPGLHHHLLVAEKDQVLPIGKMILQYIFDK